MTVTSNHQDGADADLFRTDLTAAEQALADRIAERREELVALACELISYDTTSRSAPTAPARQEHELQQSLARRLRSAGLDVDLWEPTAAETGDHPLSAGETLDFSGRPQLAARLRGSHGVSSGAVGTPARSVMFNGHIDAVPAAREDGWEHNPFEAVVSENRISGRGACDMKGGIAAMVIAAETLAENGGLRGDLVVCTNTEEESGGIGALACARHGVSADYTIVPEPTGLEVWPACRGSVYCTVEIPGRAGHAEQEHGDWREGGAVNAIEKAMFLLEGVRQLRSEWRSRASSRHPLLAAPDVLATRLISDSGWDVTIPDHARLTLAVLILPSQADAHGWTKDVQQEVEQALLRWCSSDSWMALHPPRFDWHTQVNPWETPSDAANVQTLVAVNRALGLPTRLGGLGSWYDGATFALETGTLALMYGPSHIDWAHTVGEYVPIDDLVHCAQGLAVAAHRLCS